MNETSNKEIIPTDTEEQMPEFVAEPNLEVDRLKGWIAEQDVALAGLVDQLEKQRPDLFDSMDAFIEHFKDVAVAVGRREQLNDIMEHLGQPPQN